ncbi:MAG TPA: SAF domain-containing protein [Micromonosporaceae bacterium]|jgi:hypothetical protein
MTAVSTKVPASRSNGSAGLPPGGPVPMPRVVGNRRIRTGGIALATMLLALGAALSGIALVSVAKTSSYLGVKQDVAVGSVIQSTDLTSVQLSGGSGLLLIPAAQIRRVVGMHATVELKPGTLLTPSDLNDRSLGNPGDMSVGIVVKSTDVPHKLAAGEAVILLPLNTSSTASTGAGAGAGAGAGRATVSQASGIPATVLSVSAPASNGTIAMVVAVSPDASLDVANDNANAGISVSSILGS